MAEQPNLIGDFTRGDSLQVEVTLTVKGQPDPLANSTVTLVLKAIGTDEQKINIAMTVQPGAEADAGRCVLQALPADTLVPVGRYKAFIVRTRGPTDRWTFHREQLVVLEGAD